ncbi:MAG: DUF262 domain-containing protein [Chloroflexota bacterium]|nr:DUF262 domain-containing protein [Chloroflexota bacterium]
MTTSTPTGATDREWFDDYVDHEGDAGYIDEYDITSTPNDFNVITLYNYIDAGFVKIPGFQRHFVWSLPMASRLIESLILGLPVPQLFFYEESNNRFLVIDGQQRLMTIYYFIRGRFPRKDQVVTLRQIFEDEGHIPDSVFADDTLFRDFRLWLPDQVPGRENKFHRRTYDDLEDYKMSFDLRPVRTIVVRQNKPSNDNTSVFEIFNRLNTGGMNLRPQEIRASLYHSDFYDALAELNLNSQWRLLLTKPQPDRHMKDVELLVRALAMLVEGDKYAPSMIRFLNSFSKQCQLKTTAETMYLKDLFESFLEKASALPDGVFVNPMNNRFNIALLEAVFAAACGKAYREGRLLRRDCELDGSGVMTLASDAEFREASQKATTDSSNVATRLRLGREYIRAL